MSDWNDGLQKNDTTTDAQFGFKPDHSTLDAIFISQSLINKKNKGQEKYCIVY